MIELKASPRVDLPLLLERVFPALRGLIQSGYLSLTVEGAENIPRRGPVVFVSNHSGWCALDAFLLTMTVVDAVGPERAPYTAVQDQLLQVPCVGPFLTSLGGFPATWLREPRKIPKEMRIFTIYPEGTEGNCKPFWAAYQMRAWRTGFVRVAVDRGARVVPVAAIGGEECLPVATTIRCLKPFLGTILPLPLCALPLPARWKFIFHKPVSVGSLRSAAARGNGTPLEQHYSSYAESVRATVQSALDRETADHGLVRLGRFVARSPRLAAPDRRSAYLDDTRR